MKVGHGSPLAMQKGPGFPVRLWLEQSPSTASGKSLGNSTGFALVKVCGVTVYFCYLVFVGISFTCIY